MYLKKAELLAHKIKADLENTEIFTRVEIAGSIRRGCNQVNDIEIVAAPIWAEITDLFGEQKWTESSVEALPNLLDIVGGEKYIKKGDRYKQIILNCGEKLDLFIVYPPASWGIIYTIRTGPREFSKKIVTQENYGGYLNNNCFVKNGQLIHNGQVVEVLEEKDFFDYLTIDYLEPEER